MQRSRPSHARSKELGGHLISAAARGQACPWIGTKTMHQCLDRPQTAA